jgi:O-antigen biosynthesis protein
MENINRYLKFSENWDPNDPKHLVLALIESGDHVLDVGCSYGSFAKRLVQKGCVVDGVENYPPAIKVAKSIHNEIYEIDLNNYSELSKVIKKYDVISFLDVLEHCIDPSEVLSELKKNLTPKGKIYISVPNIVNLIDRISILRGRFEYEEYGVMDKTHVRFFTRKTAIQLVADHFGSVRCIGYTPRHPLLKPFLRFRPTLFAMQFIIEGKNH